MTGDEGEWEDVEEEEVIGGDLSSETVTEEEEEEGPMELDPTTQVSPLTLGAHRFQQLLEC